MPAFSDYLTPQDVGSPSNGIGNDTPFVQSILNSGKNVYIPSGNYRFDSLVEVNNGRSVLGSEARPTIAASTNGGVLFDVAGSDVSIKNIRGDFNGLASGGGLVRLRNDMLPMERIELKRLISFGGNALVYDFANGNTIVSLTIQEVVGRVHRGLGIKLNKVFAYLRMIDNLVDYVGSASHNHIGYCLFNNQGAWWERCDVTGGVVDPTTTSNHGFYFQNCVANWISNCMADTVGGGGLFLDGGNSHFYVNRFISSLVGTHPFSIVGNNRIALTGCEAGGRSGLPYAPSHAGFVLINNSNLIVDSACRGYNNVGGLLTNSGNTNSIINPFNG